MPSSVDLGRLTFEHSKDEGIFLDLKQGKYKLGVGKQVTKDQANRVIAVIYMDTTLGVSNEADRLTKGYSEFATTVAKQKYKMFKPEYVWVDVNGKLVRDVVSEESKSWCVLKKLGKTDKKKIYGIRPLEIKLAKKDYRRDDDSRSDEEDRRDDDRRDDEEDRNDYHRRESNIRKR